MIKFSKLKIIILLVAFYLLLALPAKAASLNLTSPSPEIGVGQKFQIDLMLDAENQDINAAEGTISFPEEFLELKEIRDGDSVISFWIEKPVLSLEKIKFSGVIPGGFSGVLSPYYKGGRPEKILSLIFSGKAEGSGAIEIRDARVLLNDGQGTQASLAISNFQFLISKKLLDSIFHSLDSKKDTDPPELFTPEVTRDPNVFDGKWFLVFAAQDKSSGVDRYEIAEKRGGLTQNYAELPWQTSESPYLLKDQKLKSYIYVKAVDKAGNARIVSLAPKIKWYQKPIMYIFVISVIIIGVIIIARWLWRKYRKTISM